MEKLITRGSASVIRGKENGGSQGGKPGRKNRPFLFFELRRGMGGFVYLEERLGGKKI